MVGQTFL